jgi:hypothetical protein
MNDALGESRRGFRAVRLPHPDESEQPRAHLTRNLAANADLGAANPLDDRAHL